MRIGEFSNQGGVSKDTVRYYVEEGLLIPKMENGYMRFSERDIRDLAFIQKYKQANFSIREIRLMLSIHRTTNLTEPDAVKDYYDILEKKRLDICAQIDSLNESIATIDASIEAMNERMHRRREKLGVPLKALSLLACPRCGKTLKLEQAQLTDRYVYEGTLFCECGYHARIDNGIVLTGRHYTGEYDQTDFSCSGHYDSVGKNFVTYLQKSYDYVYSELSKENLSGKVVLETTLDGYYFLPLHFSQLKNDCIYVMIDKFEETITLFKNRIEALELELDILFIADASLEYPLKPGCIDCFIDFYGEEEFMMYHPRTFIEMGNRFFGPSLKIIGAFMYYDDHAKSLARVPERYPESSPNDFSAHVVEEACRKEGLSFCAEEIGFLTETYEKWRYHCHVSGEKLHMKCFTAQRRQFRI